MSEGLALALALVVLAGTLGAAVVQRYLPEAVAASAGALLLVAVGAISLSRAGHALRGLAPTVGFLAALLALAEGARREGLFEAMGAAIAAGSRGSAQRLLAYVFVVAAGVTALLGLDATVVLLTPVVFATAARMRTSPRPHVYACGHLANSGSLLLPVSNLTNLIAFQASGLSFARFAALMALPTAGAVGVEWFVLRRFFAIELGRPGRREAQPPGPPLPRFPLVVLALTLAGFALSSVVGLAAVWVAAAGAVALNARAIAARRMGAAALLRALEPGFLFFVLGLGIVVAAASAHGLASAVGALLPARASLWGLLGIAALSAVLANLVNNLPATLMLAPAVVLVGHAAILAMLVGVNVGPNLTYAGSLATLLWRRVLHAQDADFALGEYLRLGVLTVPAALVAATVLLWLSLQV